MYNLKMTIVGKPKHVVCTLGSNVNAPLRANKQVVLD